MWIGLPQGSHAYRALYNTANPLYASRNRFGVRFARRSAVSVVLLTGPSLRSAITLISERPE